MHFLLGIGLVAALIAFTFGENIARIFVGAALASLAAFVLLVTYVSIVEATRQAPERPNVVRMGSAR